jgi:hypothetical protein
MARKPGFLTNPNDQGNNLQRGASKELTLALTPEALIVGTVSLPTAEAPDPIALQIFRRDVQDGRAHWVEAGGTQSTTTRSASIRFTRVRAMPVPSPPILLTPIRKDRCLDIHLFIIRAHPTSALRAPSR